MRTELEKSGRSLVRLVRCSQRRGGHLAGLHRRTSGADSQASAFEDDKFLQAEHVAFASVPGPFGGGLEQRPARRRRRPSGSTQYLHLDSSSPVGLAACASLAYDRVHFFSAQPQADLS